MSTPPERSTLDVAADFAGQYGFLGIQLIDPFGQVDYGYLQMGMDPPAPPNPRDLR